MTLKEKPITVCQAAFGRLQSRKASRLKNRQEVKRLKVENQLHQRRAVVFNIQLTEAMKNASALEEYRDTAVICINYEKNLPLLITGIGHEYLAVSSQFLHS